MNETKTVVLVGHCGPDAFMLKHAVERLVPGTVIASALSRDELDEHRRPDRVLLVNRVPDGDFDGADGIDLIRAYTSGDDAPVALLISNFPDAQDDAVAAGARPGFGKSELYDEHTAERLRAAVGG